MRTVFLKIIQAIWYLFATLIILSAVLISIAHLITPLLNHHRNDFEAWASRLLHVPISMNEVHVDWRGYSPEFSFSHVVILDQQTHKPAFEIQEIKIGFQLFSSLLERRIVLQDIIFSGANVTILQDASGMLSIKDLPVHKKKSFKTYHLMDVMQWIFSQPYLALRDLDVQFIPYKGEQRELTFHKVTLWNKDSQHKINASFVLHQEIPTEVKAQIDWTGSISDWTHIKAHAYFNLEGFSLSQWLKPHEHLLNQFLSGWQIRQGIGGADVWLDWSDQKLQQVQSIFQWYDLEFYSAFDQKTYAIQRLSGHVGWKREGEKQIFAGDSILINFPRHFWPATTFYVALASAQNDHAAPDNTTKPVRPEGLEWQLKELRVGYLDLKDVLPIIMANSGLPAQWRKSMGALSLSGSLQDLNFIWQDSLRDFTHMSASGKAASLSFRPYRQFPGMMNLSGSWEWNGKTGNVKLASRNLKFTLQSIFDEPLYFNEATGHFNIERDKAGLWSFQTPDMRLNNADLNASGAVQIILPPGGLSPTIDLKSEFSLLNATHVERYLPTALMNEDLLDWIESAFLKGRLESGKAVISGKLKDFPFDSETGRAKKGIFEISGNLKDIDFHYAPQWPIIRQAEGEINFSGRSMHVLIDSAQIMDIPIKQVKAVIPYIGEEKPQILNVKGQVQSDLMNAMAFIHQSPLEKIIGKELANIQLTGPATLSLLLSIPLSKPETAKVVGKVQMMKDRLTLPAWNLRLDQVRGSFQFTDHGISAEKLQGSLWSKPISLSMSTIAATEQTPSYIQVKIKGTADVTHLDRALNLSLSRFLQGATAFRARLDLYKAGNKPNQIYFNSNLQGLTVDLPAPFGKDAAEQRNFAVNFNISQTAQYFVNLKYGDLVQAQLKVSQENGFHLIDINSAQLKGRIRFAYPFNKKQAVQAQLERVVVSPGNKKTISSISPYALPPLEINVRQFIYGNMNLGQLALITSPAQNGLTIQKFNLVAPDYHFKSHGQWVVENNAQRSQIQGTIQSSNVKTFLSRLSIQSENVIVQKGQATFNLQWRGPPYGFSLANMRGNFSFALEKGRIINLNESDNNKMDLGRMLSLFSLQTIPRRLSLDFSDLFEQGYSFDFIRGDFSLRQGDAYTKKDITLEGPVASVKAYGRIGLLNKDYDLVLSISPHVTESLPVVAGAITLNPLVGAAAWLVNKVVISNQVSKVITYNYTVTGPWSNPVWRSTSQAK